VLEPEEADMRQLVVVVLCAVALAGCGNTTGGRALTGGALGAGGGALLGGVTGLGAGTGALLGGAGGAGVGALTAHH
jgi:osmotically inducible lipoprotein OsmB